ncbi:hypothetical protein [Salibacterium qingdaonense]|uniref:DUF2157 domain-containing protein n=1 Tax=Salibacterium qingdaonense TaxID=266892 RepID=A0A1I4JKP6_9BACI|nr:hypothetical protein [Salibacterium qingdaonense]SFL66676.1 hypothetical protein SAMN04488054_103193 [Salibacterium qingdaonense]
MDEYRRDILIKEIKYWKANQLLPDDYCNFLLMLYSEGEEAEAISGESPPFSASRPPQKRFIVMLCLAVAAVVLTFIVIHFTSFSLLLQTLSHLVLAAFVFGMAVYARKQDGMLFHLLISAGAVIFFTGSTTSVMRFEESNVLLYVTILLNCSIWFAAGYYRKLPYLLWAGGAGVLLTSLFIFIL